MNKILKILPKILLGVFMVVLFLGNAATAYILFAPDTFPKPFYLMYMMPNSAVSAAQGSAPVAADVNPPNVAEAATGTTEQPITLANIKPGQGLMVDTGTKIVNLVEPTGRKYLRAGVVLEFVPTDPKYFSMTAEEKTAYKTTFDTDMATKLPVINDIIITLLSSQTFDSVYTAQGKEDLRKKLMDDINKQLPENKVLAVYFTEFVVQ